MKKPKRDYRTDPKLDQKELKWWNDHAATLVPAWEMDPLVSRKIRGYYLALAKSFFLKDLEKATVLDLGCGSGWVGQAIAGSKLKIIGTDFSSGQINLAQKNARRLNLSKYTEYIVSDSKTWPKFSEEPSGILIHAFLHHLSGYELEKLLQELSQKFKKGTRIWIYEPSFYHKKTARRPNLSLSNRLRLNLAQAIFAWLEKNIDEKLIDVSKAKAFYRLQALAAKNDWYLSPKEVPLEVDEFTAALKKNKIAVRRHYWGTVYSIGWVFKANVLRNRFLKIMIAALVLPIFAFADKRICREEAYLRNTIVYPNYAFHVWEGVLK